MRAFTLIRFIIAIFFFFLFIFSANALYAQRCSKASQQCNFSSECNTEKGCENYVCEAPLGALTGLCVEKKPSAPAGVRNIPGIGFEIKPRQIYWDGSQWAEQDYTDGNGQSDFSLSRINENDTRRVVIKFSGLEKNKQYQLCLHSNINNCFSGNKAVKAKSSNDNGELETFACGNGEHALKIEDKCKELDKIWFHGGHVYHLRLYDDDTFTLLKDVGFYVNHYYPNIFIEKNLVTSSIGDFIKFDENKEREFFDANLKVFNESFGTEFKRRPEWGKISQDFARIVQARINTNKFGEYKWGTITNNNLEHLKSIDVYEGATPPQSLAVVLLGKKPGGDQENNYQIITEGQGLTYKVTRCATVIYDDSNKTEYSQPVYIDKDESEIQLKDAGEGNYLIKINEQVDEGGIKGALNPDKCNGGFTYWHILLKIEKQLKDDVQKNRKAGIYYASIVEVQKDPNESDLEGQKRGAKFPKSPCAKVDTEGNCLELSTGIGRISTDPVQLLKTLFGLVLSIAGVGAFFLLIYSGYILMTSAGDKQKIAASRETITSTIVGLLFIIFAIVILEIIGVDILRLPGFK